MCFFHVNVTKYYIVSLIECLVLVIQSFAINLQRNVQGYSLIGSRSADHHYQIIVRYIKAYL